jgi:hypothetical protein
MVLCEVKNICGLAEVIGHFEYSDLASLGNSTPEITPPPFQPALI